ncbi:FAD-dependent oxidoreductase [Gimesia chilikensis]|uniref:FAD-dependent oxidoreductase n=1 Tax=Gimesia chilikensis TaxID=2605989 RepID=UPI00118B5050|nr:FAD-dependent oxidoreductase [Gimesia chilikensis]QDT84957.1 Xanthan lyase precursor [Gimesia chilikensis]
MPRSLIPVVVLFYSLLVILSPLSAAEPDHKVDICVYGGTSGGVVAAVKAARLGKTAILIEPGQQLGGMSSGGLSFSDMGKSATVAGMAREFYERIGKKYGKPLETRLEPHVAETVFEEMIKEAGVKVIRGEPLQKVQKQGPRIVELTTEQGTRIAAEMFIDCTYEGDLLAAAGVSYSLTREANSQYNETLNGVQLYEIPQVHFGKYDKIGRRKDRRGLWDRAIPLDPYKIPGKPESGLLPLIEEGELGTIGEAAPGVQAYCFRLCVTDQPENRIPIAPPANYDPARYEIVARYIAACEKAGDDMDLRWFTKHDALPNGKFDFNTAYFGLNYVGGNKGYSEASHAERQQIIKEHENYARGLFYFLKTDERVPQKVRDQVSRYGLCKDEFKDNRGWPHQLYIRESRRMVSDLVMTEHYCRHQVVAPKSVGLASYGIDIHEIRRIVHNGIMVREGKLLGHHSTRGPYPIGFDAIVPKTEECDNLLVTFAISASHVAFGSTRMEPVLMILSQSAATAASQAIDVGCAIQEVNYQRLRTQLLADGQLLDWPSPVQNGKSTARVIVNPETLPGIVLDDSDAEFTGSWAESNGQPSPIGRNYSHDGNKDRGQKSARFTPAIKQSGDYEVRLLYTWHPNRSNKVPVTIQSSDGKKTVIINQRQPALVKQVPVSLGTFHFEAGQPASVTVSNQGADGYVVVDGLQLLPVKSAEAERAGKRKSGYPQLTMEAKPKFPQPNAAQAAQVAFSPLAEKTLPRTPGESTRHSTEPVQLAPSADADEVAGKSYDVIVVGGTGGGVATAVRAAREGCSVLLVQHNGHIGGMMTNGLMQWDALYGGPRSPLFSELLENIENYYIDTFGRDSRDHQTIRYTHEKYPIGWAEPHVAEREYNRLVAQEKNITLLLHHYPTDVDRQGSLIKSVTLCRYGTPETIQVKGSTFVDATYEGDLFALADVPYRVGREARDEYNEPHAGKVFVNIDGHRPESIVKEGLNIRVYGARQGSIDPTSPFSADGAVQAYNYRFCVTSDPTNRLPIPKPASYDRADYLGFHRRYIPASQGPNHKSHVNSPIMPGHNHAYPEADWPTREKIIQQHLDFGLGLVWFLQHDESIPETKRQEYLKWGLPKDEYADYDHVPYEMYVREARRIVGRHVFNENDGMLADGYRRTPIHQDSIAVTDWYMDSHSCTIDSRPGFKYDGKLILTEESRPSQIPYRALLPQGVDNLLVPVCLSATHIAWGAIRLEPVFLSTGEAAGYAAALAKQHATTPADLNPDLLLKTLVRRRQLVSFFNDLKVNDSDPAIPAAQYFATKGFFNDYNARLNEPLTKAVHDVWERGLKQMEQGTSDPGKLAVEVQQAEEQKSPTSGETRGAFLLKARSRIEPRSS